MSDAVVLLLSCGHRRELPATVSDEDVYCWLCASLRSIVRQTNQWRIRCLDCRYGRGFGAAGLAANLAADKHCRARPTHRVQILEGSRLEAVRVPQLFLRELPLGIDDPPF